MYCLRLIIDAIEQGTCNLRPRALIQDARSLGGNVNRGGMGRWNDELYKGCLMCVVFEISGEGLFGA